MAFHRVTHLALRPHKTHGLSEVIPFTSRPKFLALQMASADIMDVPPTMDTEQPPAKSSRDAKRSPVKSSLVAAWELLAQQLGTTPRPQHNDLGADGGESESDEEQEDEGIDPIVKMMQMGAARMKRPEPPNRKGKRPGTGGEAERVSMSGPPMPRAPETPGMPAGHPVWRLESTGRR